MKKKIMQLLMGQLVLVLSAFRKVNRRRWIFSSTDNTEFNYNSKYLFLYVKEHLPEIEPLFVINDDEKRKSLAERYGEQYFIETKTFRGMQSALTGGVWFVSAGLPVYAVGVGRKRRIVNLWHGVPLKKIALKEEQAPKWKKLYFKFVFSGNYHDVLTTSWQLIPIMTESLGVEAEKVKVWGQPRNDVILKPRLGLDSLEQRMGKLPPHQKKILYAPTYRDGETVQLFPFSDMDLERLQEYLEQEQILLFVRTHIEETGDCSAYFGRRIQNFGSEILEDVTEYLFLFDVLITDYSSVYIDYLLLNRPLIFLPYDQEDYLKKRGLNFVYDEVTPGEKPKDFQEFLNALDNTVHNDTYQKRRREVNDIFNQVIEPCSENICRQILKEERGRMW